MFNSSNLMKYAIGYLSKFSSSKSNLERILKNKIRRLNVEKRDKFLLYNAIDDIINKLENLKLINDIDYTSSKIRYLILQGKSKFFIKSYLNQKGITSETVSEAFVFCENNNPDWEIQSARTYIRKKNILINEENKNKILSKMARAGFTYDLSNQILNEVNDVEDEFFPLKNEK
jgi:SOS response regulatory protein OraA/RecX